MSALQDWAITGRSVEPEWRKRRRAKRGRRFVMVNWTELTAAALALRMDRASKLYLVLCLHQKLARTRAANGWIELALHDLEALDLADPNLGRTVSKLERANLVEVQRRPGKRPRLRLIKQGDERWSPSGEPGA
jgi:DNA-binding transcriptional ArsR family regulator